MDNLQEQPAICPNCGTPAPGKFCPECGQPTHLHADTVMGIAGHFVAHELHYESKFWQTIKALWFSPGKLTIAYINQQRARYIAPISLYLFISAFFFLTVTLVNGHKAEEHAVKKQQYMSLTKDGLEMNISPEQKSNEDLTKVFFFVIPLVALLLRMVVWKKRFRYVHHVIFTLHFHAFLFTVFFLIFIFPFKKIEDYWGIALAITSLTYLATAIHKVYGMNIFKAITSALFISIMYIFLYFSCYAFYFTLLDKFSGTA